MELGISKSLTGTIAQVREKLEIELQKEGFGVLTEIDVSGTFKKKLDLDFREYLILGACNPHLAHEALSNNLDIGVLLPCNVLLYYNDAGDVVVTMMNIADLMGSLLPEAEKIASVAGAKLQRVLDNI